MEAICTGDGSGSAWRGRGSTFATILTEFSGGFSPHFHNFSTMIGPRSGHDRASIAVLGLRRSSSDHVEAIPRQKACDRGSIGPRSRGSSMHGLRRPMMLHLDGRSRLV